MDHIGIKGSFKSLFIIVLLTVYCSSCGNQKSQKEEFILNESRITVYTNNYDERGKIISSSIKITSRNQFGQTVDRIEEVYYYNDRDSLTRKETFSIDEGGKHLSSLTLYSNEKEEELFFHKYPSDTLQYICRIKDKKGNFVWEYMKENMPFLSGESISERTYDDQGRLVSSVHKDIMDNESYINSYTYIQLNDTLLQTTTCNDSLNVRKKEYRDKDMKIETTEYFNPYSVDTIFTAKDRIYSVSYEEDLKFVDIKELDQHGNYTKTVSEYWIKLTPEREEMLEKIKQLN